MSAPRVLVSGVVLAQPDGGVRRHAAELLPRAARLLAAEGGGLALLEGRERVPFALPAEVQRIRSRAHAHPTWLRARDEPRALARALADARAAGRPFDLVHAAHLPAAPQVDVLLLHDLRRVQHGPVWRRALARRWIARAVASARLVTVSAATAVLLRSEFGAESVDVVPNGCDHFTPLPRAAAPDARLLVLGHLEPRKNPELVVRALAADPGLPGVLFAGRPVGGIVTRLQRLAARLGVLERVRYFGPYLDEELPELLARAACVVLPSRLEGFGISVLEALRARAPLAVSDIAAHREVAGGHVARFDPRDPGDCARAVRAALVQDAETTERLARRAARFTWDASAAALVASWQRAAR
jgi:glycosyltransferase involved in cell wall biosynthesis